MSDAADTVDLWLGKLTRLRAGNGKSTDGVSGLAPHKPLLLHLAAIDAGLHSLRTEPTLSADQVRQNIRTSIAQ